jgi:hypothetical protein
MYFVSPEREWLGPERCGDRRIDRQLGSPSMSDSRDRRNVGQAQDRVGRGFDVDDFRVRPHGRRHSVEIGRIDRRDGNPVLGQNVVRQFGNAGIADARQDQMIPAAETVQEQSADRRHTAGEAQSRLPTLERRKPCLQEIQSRVAPPGIKVGRGLVEVIGRKAHGIRVREEACGQHRRG